MFVRVQLVNNLEPRQENSIYAMDLLVDMAKYPQAQALTLYLIADSNVDGSPMEVAVVGNDMPDPGGGIVLIAEPPLKTTLPNKYSKIALSVEISKAPFPYYGVVVKTGPTAPSKGRCQAYADVWWPGER